MISLTPAALFLIVQAASFLFAWSVAKHDAPAVTNFRVKGIEPKDNSVFHRYNVWLKGVFVFMAFLPSLNLLDAAASALWVYLVFDIALNLNRPGFAWYYVGANDADGRRLTKWFGGNAGKYKAAICLLLILAINILHLCKDLK